MIFEGDYLELKDRICIVRWNEKCGCWDLDFVRLTGNEPDPSFSKLELGRTLFWKQYKVIGNKFDNPQPEDLNYTFLPNTLKLLEQIKNDLEYAVRYVGFAIARGEVGESLNCFSLVGAVRDATNQAKEKLDRIWGSEKSKKD